MRLVTEYICRYSNSASGRGPGVQWSGRWPAVSGKLTADGPKAKPGMNSETVVLLSGGLDSVVLLAQESRDRLVQPVYISTGLAWEVDEQRMVDRLLTAPVFEERIRPIVHLDVSVRDIYSSAHWAVV